MIARPTAHVAARNCWRRHLLGLAEGIGLSGLSARDAAEHKESPVAVIAALIHVGA